MRECVRADDRVITAMFGRKRASATGMSDAPLSRLRLVTTLPPKSWFGGNNLARAREHGQALRALGAAVYEFDTEAMYANDLSRIEQQKQEITAFRPDLVIGTPHGGYVVQGGGRAESTGLPGSRPLNLFIE